ncbi:MAG: hypothetical protein JXQ27_16880, partial [Acidobacteria bacterium]|nr:hypothetical protein [Acidobacteriota bacterium]
CRLIGGSYVSAESALAYHGVIPERVTGTYCVRYQGRALEFETPIGFFVYRPVPTTPYRFLEGVRREIIEAKPCLMAGPLRALADLVYLRRLDWQGRTFLTDGLRLDLDPFLALPDDDVEAMAAAFRSRRVRHFLHKMQQEVCRP